jgi:hypothetical protein
MFTHSQATINARPPKGAGTGYPEWRWFPAIEEPEMTDDLKNRGEPDRSRISLSEEHEVRYWTKALGVLREELERTVRSVENSADAVRQALQKAV